MLSNKPQKIKIISYDLQEQKNFQKRCHKVYIALLQKIFSFSNSKESD